MNCVLGIVGMKNSEEKRQERIDRVMENFKSTPDVIGSIIALNDGLYERFRMAFEDLLKMKKLVDEDIDSGRLKVSGYEMYPEFFFGYDKMDGIPTADHYMLMDLSDETQFMMPSMTLDEQRFDGEYSFDVGFLHEYEPDLSWNIENLDLPGLENHHIYMFMHHIFQDANTFCPADIPFLKPDDLQWQITVQYEFFKR